MQFGNIQADKDVNITAVEGENATIDNSTTITQVPQQIQEAVESSELSNAQQEEVSRAILDLQKQLESQRPNESLVKQLLKKVKTIAPDIIEIVATTFANPLAGLGLAIEKLLDD